MVTTSCMCSRDRRDSDFRNARVDNLLHNAHTACMPLQHCNRGALNCTVLYYREVGGAKVTCVRVHVCVCQTTCYRTTHSFRMHMHSHTNELCTSTSMLHYTVQYGAPYCSEIFAWKLNTESRLLVEVATFEWRLVDSKKSWIRATLIHNS